MNPLISVIVLVYNVEKYLRRCIDSVISQSYNNFEIILVNDGSTDKSGEICKEYIHEKRITYISKENGGLSSARNVGLDIANGKYIMFLDSDDYINKDSLSNLSKIMNQNSPDIIAIKSRVVYEDGSFEERSANIATGEYGRNDYFRLLNENNCYVACAPYFVYNKKFLEINKFKFYHGILHEDELWMPQILLKAEKIYYSGILVYYHCLRKGSITQSNNFERRGKSLIIVLTELLKIESIVEDPFADVLRDEWADRFFQAVGFLKASNEIVNCFRKKYILKFAKKRRNRLKAVLYLISPKLFYYVWKCSFNVKNRNK